MPEIDCEVSNIKLPFFSYDCETSELKIFSNSSSDAGNYAIDIYRKTPSQSLASYHLDIRISDVKTHEAPIFAEEL